MLAEDDDDDDEVGEVLTLPLQAHHAMEKMEEFVHKVTMTSLFIFFTAHSYFWQPAFMYLSGWRN